MQGLSLTELVLANAADGAHPVFGKVFELCARSDAISGIAYFGLIFVPTNITNVLHKDLSFEV